MLCRRCCMSASQRMFGLLWNVVVAHEHRRQDGSRNSWAMYDGEMPDSDRWTSVATLKLTRWRTGSQCSWRRRAAAFWTDCNRFISPSVMPKNRVAGMGRQWTMTASSRTVQSCAWGGSDCPVCSRHCSSSDYVLVKWILPKSERGKDCISCAKNYARSPSRLCTA